MEKKIEVEYLWESFVSAFVGDTSEPNLTYENRV